MLTPMKLARKFLYKRRLKRNPALPFQNISYAQDGEDIFLAEYFRNRDQGFFVDIGAHHPFRFSNTYLLYQKGWRGINIDATPGAMKLFDQYRPRDINIELGISDRTGAGIYYLFEEPALNGFESPVTLRHLSQGNKLRSQERVLFSPLKDVLEQHVPDGTPISLMSMDIEGMELSALQSNNWDKYIPEVLLIEQDAEVDYEAVRGAPVTLFLKQHHYSLFYRYHRSCIYIYHQE